MTSKELDNVRMFNLSAIERSNLAAGTKAKYTRAIETYLKKTGATLSDYDALSEYAAGLSASGRAFLKAAIRLISEEYANMLKASATPDNLPTVQASLHRLDALRETVKVTKHAGVKAHTWLTQKQVRDITAACGDDLQGKRDWIILGLLLGAGLRREELAELTFDALKRQPRKGGALRDVLEVTGKGAKDRVIPIKPLLAQRLREWRDIVGGGLVARSLGRKQELGESMSSVAIFHLVRKYGKKIGVPHLAPHDLRRTYAQLGYDAGVPITQISVLLGHSSVEVTQRYLDLSLDLESTVSDFVPLSGD